MKRDGIKLILVDPTSISAPQLDRGGHRRPSISW
jgi:hypothetical protein